jgi:starch synthase (maltosyl-transferring)
MEGSISLPDQVSPHSEQRTEKPGPPPPRVVLEGLHPRVDEGRFPVKRIVGDKLRVTVDMFADGHDHLAGSLLFRHQDEPESMRVKLKEGTNDLWIGEFRLEKEGRYLYTVEGWVDAYSTWEADTVAKHEAGQDISVELLAGSHLVEETASRLGDENQELLLGWARVLDDESTPPSRRLRMAREGGLGALMASHPDPSGITRHANELQVVVDRERAAFSAWYEFFPRSCSGDPTVHGTLEDCMERLEYVADMGFDVVYLPPVHPIGRTHRKGPNNAPAAGPGDPGSPWAIGSEEGGHSALHPSLGTLDDFRAFVRRAEELGMETALDLAFQCSPDHPWVTEHPEWFRRRADGSIQYAENPPKKYQDIYPLDFETQDWVALWHALEEVVTFWVEKGIRIFRVDNPHTKPFAFWEWLIGRVKVLHPDVLFLSEAFTRPKKMHRLAKVGFSQSYTYFTWRNTKEELSRFLTSLFVADGREYLRPNLWPNTPDILNEYLQVGGRPAFLIRLTLAAMAGASYGIYGPPFELCEGTPREPGSEEYLDSEKYQIRAWDLGHPDSLRPYIRRINRIRRANPALQQNVNFQLLEVENAKLFGFLKKTDDGSDVVIVIVNLDPHYTHSGWVHLPLKELGLDPDQSFQVHDLITDARYLWSGSPNFVAIDPQSAPAHILKLRRRIRTERDFEYFV